MCKRLSEEKIELMYEKFNDGWNVKKISLEMGVCFSTVYTYRNIWNGKYVNCMDYYEENARKNGFESYYDYRQENSRKNGFNGIYDYNKKCLEKRGFERPVDYREALARRRGFESYRSYLEYLGKRD